MRLLLRCWRYKQTLLLSSVLVAIGSTYANLQRPTLTLPINDDIRLQVTDRFGQPLSVSYQNAYNTADILPLHRVPVTLREAFITAEDRQFLTHRGIDWSARARALWQNLTQRRVVSGASSITEQVVRIVHPRPRTLWSRWLETFEAMWLERIASKGEILEFYLNQVPYAAHRRGVVQAARYYFNRDIDTLTTAEMLALATLPRAPSALDLYKNPQKVMPAVQRLQHAMQAQGTLPADMPPITQMALENASAPIYAPHFVQYVRSQAKNLHNSTVRTTIDGALQQHATQLLEERLRHLRGKKVRNGALLVADHTTGEILAWVVSQNDASTASIDAVQVPRQPGSSLKPFLYALSFEQGWSAATVLNDAPMSEKIGNGLHQFRNYSGTFYGNISLREALGNSLNIPALQAIDYVTPQKYLTTLHALGFDSLTQPAAFYNDGLALGNGEVTLLEMVQAYGALAQRGVFRPLRAVLDEEARAAHTVYTPESASLIGNILSDPYARRREFGAGSVLNLPIQTAAKTGTSTDYRDAWVMAYDSRYVVGIWMGNLDRTPTDGLTGSTGPALVMRSVMNMLNQSKEPQPLYLSAKLRPQQVCLNSHDTPPCVTRTEYTMPNTVPVAVTVTENTPKTLKIVRPRDGLHLAYDPRLSPQKQALALATNTAENVRWLVNQQPLNNHNALLPLQRGKHTITAQKIDTHNNVLESDNVQIWVK